MTAEIMSLAEIAESEPDMLASAIESLFDSAQFLIEYEGASVDVEADLALIRDGLDVPEHFKDRACVLLAAIRKSN